MVGSSHNRLNNVKSIAIIPWGYIIAVAQTQDTPDAHGGLVERPFVATLSIDSVSMANSGCSPKQHFDQTQPAAILSQTGACEVQLPQP
jgi:hypothetical protein